MSEYMIMLNNFCNLNCEYCFAKETMSFSSGEMPWGTFLKVVEFGLTANNKQKKGIGIIGGEPTLHSRFAEMMRYLIDDNRVESVDVFTNGTTLLNYASTFLPTKMHILINCNSPSRIGSHMYEKMIAGMDELFNIGIPVGRIGLGMNIDHPDADYSYFLSLVDRYNMDSVRLSVSVPPNVPKYIMNRIR